MIKIDLCKDWHVRYAPLYKGIEEAPSIATAKKDNFISQWMKTDIPCDVHTPLIENGIIKEPLEGLNSFDCEWIEGKSWWFKKSFQIPSDFFKNEKIELVLDYIDLTADFLLNGLVVGRHQSVHYPFIADVTKYVHEGENELIVRVTTGTENINDKMTAPFATTVNKTYRRGDERRVFLRKPQYVFGWD
ncbi:MAG TPA: hypothetical protein PLG43_04270, partial [Spirochaetia bacterium]|nr:hypothetical protein [Spirochaetia bacterium]